MFIDGMFISDNVAEVRRGESRNSLLKLIRCHSAHGRHPVFIQNPRTIRHGRHLKRTGLPPAGAKVGPIIKLLDRALDLRGLCVEGVAIASGGRGPGITS
jgi:hypothetical protein